MLKYDQFESKNQNKKNQKRLNKRRKENEDDLEQKRQEIRDKMNVYVNSPSSYEGVAIHESLTPEIKITPEWILSKFSWSTYTSEGNIFVYADIYNSHWVELALCALEISYLRAENTDYNGKIYISFELKKNVHHVSRDA